MRMGGVETMPGLLPLLVSDSVDMADNQLTGSGEARLAGCRAFAFSLEKDSFQHRLFYDIPALRVRKNAIVNRVGAG